MTDKLISDLGAIGASIADTTVFEAQRSGQTTTEKAAGTDLTTYIGSKNLSYVANAATARGNLGAKVHPGYISGRYYTPPHYGMSTAGGAGGLDSIRLFPFMLGAAVTISELGARVTTIQAAQNFQAAIYAADGTTQRPTSTALGSTGNISTAVQVTLSGAVGANFTLQPGILYWAATNCSHATPVLNSIHNQFAVPHAWLQGTATVTSILQSSQTFIAGLTTPQTFGTWPDLTSATFTEIATATIPLIFFKAA
jgi:hypothetical protein